MKAKTRRQINASLSVLLCAVFLGLAAAVCPLPCGVSADAPLSGGTVYHVAQLSGAASDSNEGTEAEPFLTVSRAAEIMQPGDTAIIHEGVYRERVSPANSGRKDAYITFRAAEGEKVTVTGAEEWDPVWVPEKYVFSTDSSGTDETTTVDNFWEAQLSPSLFAGANYFALPNLIRNDFYPEYIPGMNLVRGCLFMDGKAVRQVVLPTNGIVESTTENVFWVEENGLTVHIRLGNGADPNGHKFEVTVREQVFAPEKEHIDYISAEGLTLTQAANSLPSPGSLRALAGPNGGKHWRISDCDISFANTYGLEPDKSGNIYENNNVHDCFLSGLDAQEKAVSKRNRLAKFAVAAIGFKSLFWKDYKDYSWNDFTIPDIPGGRVSVPAENVFLPSGDTYDAWEKESVPLKTYHVAQNDPRASDSNDGSREHPFLTIGKAAEVLDPGETVIVHEGVYREFVSPARGGTDAEHMIWYRAAEGESVTVKGSDIWEPVFEKDGRTWVTKLSGDMFTGANVFCLQNTWMDDRWDCAGPQAGQFRGQIFLDGVQLTQMQHVSEFAVNGKNRNAFCVDPDGVTVRMRLADGSNPNGLRFEITTRPQVFSPAEKYLNYIGISGFTMLHAANSNPIPYPQQGLVSANGGHHWIIEDCEIGFANTVGIDLGGQWWYFTSGEYQGYHIVRRNKIHDVGMCGIAAWHTKENPCLLIEDNYLYNCCTMSDSHCESGAIKIHSAIDSLIRRNVVANVWHGNAIWLDGESVNARVTQNVCAVTHRTGWGDIMLEAYSGPYLVDNNIVSYQEGGRAE